MKLRTKRHSPLGERVPLVDLDEALHRPSKEALPEREAIAGLVTIPGAKLGVVREWAEAMGYLSTEERFIVSSGDGSND